jgi:hypothetical protein
VINLTSWERVEFDFQDDKVSMEIRGLYNNEYALVVPFMEMAAEDSADMSQAKMGERLDSLSKLKPIFEGATRDMQGLNVDGEPVKPEMLALNMELFRLAFDVITAIVNKSMLTGKEKNSSGGQLQSSTENTQA